MSEIAHRLDLDLTGALEIASLVRAPGVSIDAAARLIEAYAGARGGEFALDTVSRALEAPLARKDPANA